MNAQPRPGSIIVAGSRPSPRLLESEEQECFSPLGVQEREMAVPAEDSAKEMAACAPNTKTYLRRLTASAMGSIARELGVSGSVSLEDLRQMVGGQLEEMGHSPWNVQVDLAETVHGVVFSSFSRER